MTTTTLSKVRKDRWNIRPGEPEYYTIEELEAIERRNRIVPVDEAPVSLPDVTMTCKHCKQPFTGKLYEPFPICSACRKAAAKRREVAR